MKPLLLKMKAFGSYGEEETIDFRKINQNLFLITGDTGAGKTTIFDAIVFALYGEASSTENKKSGFELQSQFAAMDTQPFAELTFSETTNGEECIYIVKRVPRHLRKSSRAGVKDQPKPETVTLIMPDGSEYPPKETNKKIEEIVGLTKAQFMQVAMLAQGEFMKLLRAPSAEKREIFRKLFGTDLFRRIVDELDGRLHEINSKLGQSATMIRQETGHIRIPADPGDGALSENAEMLKTAVKRITGSERPSAPDLEQLMEALSAVTGELKERVKQLEKEEKTLQAERDSKRDAQTKGQTLLKNFEEMERAETELALCEASAADIKEKESLAKKIDAAYEILDVFRWLEKAEKDIAVMEKQKAEQEDALPGLQEASEEASARESEAAVAAREETGTFSRVEERVKKSLEIFSKIQDAEKQLEKCGNELRASLRKEKDAKKALEDFSAKVKEQKTRSEELSDVKEKLAQARGHLEKAEDMLLNADALVNDGTDAVTQNRNALAALRAYDAARTAYSKKKTEFDQLERDFYDAQAGFLARKLVPGEPCPVCGSTEHPHPCAISELHKELTREALDSLRSEVAELQEVWTSRSSEAESSKARAEERLSNFNNAAAKLLDSLAAEGVEVPSEISGHLPVNGDNDIENVKPAAKAINLAVDTLVEKLRGEVRRLTEAAEEYDRLREALSHAESERSRLQNEIELAVKNTGESKTRHAEARATLDGLLTQKDFGSESEANRALKDAGEILERKQKQHSELQKAAQEAKSKMEKADTLIRQFRKQLPNLLADRNRRHEDYTAALSNTKLTEAEWKDITEAYPKNKAAALREEIDAYNQRKAAAEGGLAAAKKMIGKREKPDLDALKEAAQTAEENLKNASAAHRACENDYQADQEAWGKLDPVIRSRMTVAKERDTIDGLYQRLAGKVTGSRMDIETYAQRYYLQRILGAANRRFEVMSAGQFVLRMTSETRAGEGKNRGLDLMVYSNVTGKEREVTTLSGGESFMAALALALGTADLIQTNTAAIHLDMMFIDEGFGSLDEHSREQAVKVLQQMAGGSKMIGIISHVSELKQEIEDQLIVTKDAKGSHTHWQIS